MNQRSTKFIFIILAFLFLSVTSFGQIDSLSLNGSYLKKYWTDSKAIVASPSKWQRNDWVKFGVILSGTACLTLADQPVADFFQSRQSKTATQISKYVLEPFGGEYSLILMTGMYGCGVLGKNKRMVSTSLLAAESFALASLFARVPKILFGRERPDKLPFEGSYAFNGPFQGSSFPSGHTTAVFAVASVIARQYHASKWIPVTAYSVASLAGISRIYDNKHWLSDVVAGAAIGTLVGNLVSRSSFSSNLTVTPVGNAQFQGVRLNYIW